MELLVSSRRSECSNIKFDLGNEFLVPNYLIKYIQQIILSLHAKNQPPTTILSYV